jgi:hypothetical protein
LNIRWIVWYAISLHSVWGLVLLNNESAGWVTAISGLAAFFGSHGLGWIFLATAGISAWAVLRGGKGGVILLIPQQVVLTLAAISAIGAMETSAFADGVIRPRAFLIADQAPAVLAALWHGCAMLDHWKRGVGIHGEGAAERERERKKEV